MISVITGDIIGSRKVENPKQWINALKKLFNTTGKEPKDWQFFRGDSFQLEIKEPENTLLIALKIKSVVKSIKNLDIRLAVGIGKKSYDAPRVTESNGEAFLFSGQLFEKMKKKNLAIKSPWDDIDEQVNLCLELALLTMDKWSVSSAEIVKIKLDNPHKTQKELGKLLGIKQGTFSERQKRSGFDEIIKIEQLFRKLILGKTKHNL